MSKMQFKGPCNLRFNASVSDLVPMESGPEQILLVTGDQAIYRAIRNPPQEVQHLAVSLEADVKTDHEAL